MKRIGVITGTRAEYGLLKPLMRKIVQDETLELVLIVTGMHLSPEFGLTYIEIEKDGFRIDFKNEMLLSSDTPSGIVKSIGVATIGFADCFERAELDLVILLGDRYEILAAATAAMVFQLPIAHIHGGEITEGMIDDAIRHSITKMSTLHFVSTQNYRNRVIQLGEEPDRVWDVGSLGIENIKNVQLYQKEKLEQEINFKFDKKVIMVTFHPVIMEKDTVEQQFKNLLKAISTLENVKVIFTKANSDVNGRIINQLIDEYIKNNPNTITFTSMGQLRYLSALRYSSLVLGNSSSGIIEAPSFGIPTVNIGDRQKGRIRAVSVIDCSTDTEDILKAINKAFSKKFQKTIKDIINPYEGTNPSLEIIESIKDYVFNKPTIQKKFYNINNDVVQ